MVRSGRAVPPAGANSARPQLRGCVSPRRGRGEETGLFHVHLRPIEPTRQASGGARHRFWPEGQQQVCREQSPAPARRPRSGGSRHAGWGRRKGLWQEEGSRRRLWGNLAVPTVTKNSKAAATPTNAVSEHLAEPRSPRRPQPFGRGLVCGGGSCSLRWAGRCRPACRALPRARAHARPAPTLRIINRGPESVHMRAGLLVGSRVHPECRSPRGHPAAGPRPSVRPGRRVHPAPRTRPRGARSRDPHCGSLSLPPRLAGTQSRSSSVPFSRCVLST